MFIASASISSQQAKFLLRSESLCRAVTTGRVKTRYSEVALAVSEAGLLSPSPLSVLVWTCLLPAQEEPSAHTLFEVQCHR